MAPFNPAECFHQLIVADRKQGLRTSWSIFVCDVNLHWRRALLPLALGLSIGGCETAPSRTLITATQHTQTEMALPLAVSPDDNNNKKLATINITPFSKLEQEFAIQSQPSDTFSDAYTRLLVTDVAVDAKQTTGAGTDLPYKQRNWFARFFVGIHTSTNLTVKVSAGSYNATVPLITIDHISTKTDGESFNRVVYHQAESYPLFLFKRDGSNGIVSVRATVKISDQIQSGAAGAALQIAQGVIKEVAPQISVLTPLTQQTASNKANAIDTAINKLFAASVDEEQWSDSDVRLWKTGALITLSIPRRDRVLDGSKGSDILYKVGTWTVQFANPRPSIFSDIDVCASGKVSVGSRCKPSYEEAAKTAEAEAKPPDVLQFRLLEGASDLGTIEAYIKKQDFYTTAMKAFYGTPKATDAAQFCRSIRNGLASLNLNSVDQGIVAHAAVSGLSIPDAAYKLLKSDPQCQCDHNMCAALSDLIEDGHS